jgi:putative endonuclease
LDEYSLKSDKTQGCFFTLLCSSFTATSVAVFYCAEPGLAANLLSFLTSAASLMSDWFLYLLRDNRGYLYTGISTDVPRRLACHQAGKGAKVLRGRGPLTLEWQYRVGAHGEALRLEYRVKQWSKQRKELLVQGKIALPVPDAEE